MNQEHFFYELAVYTKNGMPLTDALQLLKGPQSAGILVSLMAGASLSEAFHKVGVFQEREIRLLRLAEETGALVQVFQDLHHVRKEQRELGGKIRSILMYPLFLLVSTVLFLVLALYFVVPPLHDMMQGMGADGAMLRVAERIRLMVPLEVMAGGTLLLVLLGAGLVKKDVLVYRLVLGRHQRTHWEMELSMELAQLLKGGMDLLDALGTLPDGSALGRHLVQGISEGMPLKVLFQEMGFSSMFLSYVAMAEETGDLCGALTAYAGLARNALLEVLRRRTAAIEPLSLLFMGVIVFWAAYALIMPMLDAYGGF